MDSSSSRMFTVRIEDPRKAKNETISLALVRVEVRYLSFRKI